MNDIGNPQSAIRNCLLPGCTAPAVSTVRLCGMHQNAFNNPGRADWPVVAAAVGDGGAAKAARAAAEMRRRMMPLDDEMTEPAEAGGKDDAMSKSETKNEICLVPGCDRPAKNRGVCGACYIHWINRRDTPTDRTRAIIDVLLPPGPHGGRRRGAGGKKPLTTKGTKATKGAKVAERAGAAATCLPDRQAATRQVCVVDGCERPAKTRGVCKPCHVYWGRHKAAPTDRWRAIEAAMLSPTRGGGKRRGRAATAAADTPFSPETFFEGVRATATVIGLLKLFGVDLVEFETPAGHRFINPDNGREALLEEATGKLVALDVVPAETA